MADFHRCGHNSSCNLDHPNAHALAAAVVHLSVPAIIDPHRVKGCNRAGPAGRATAAFTTRWSVDCSLSAAGVVDEHALAGDVRLAYRWRDPLLPGPMEVAKARIRVPAAGMLLAILLPEQLQGDARTLQFTMDLRPIR